MHFDPNFPVVCAALRNQTENRVICGPRHYDPIMRSQIENDYLGPAGWRTAEQGFVNAKGHFLTREDALHVALAHGQRKHRCGGDEKQLFSENLY